MVLRQMLIGALVLLTLVGAGCAGDDESKAPADAQRLTITVGDSLSFEPVSLNVQAGRPVLLTVKNVGNTDHDFTVVGMPATDVKNAIAGGGHGTSAGQQHGAGDTVVAHPKTKGEVTVRFTPTKSGVYEFYCSVTGHREAGMKGALTVA